MSQLTPKKCTCPCGTVLDIPVVNGDDNGYFGEQAYDVCGIQCSKCRRSSTGGNYKTGEVSGWITERDKMESQAIYEQQCFESDMNEWYGRGQW